VGGMAVVVSCEHGGCAVPPEYAPLFRGRDALLRSHRGWDPGSALLAQGLATALRAPCFVAEVTRLLVDLNRSPHNPAVFSEVTGALPRGERDALIERYHRPHRSCVEQSVREALEQGVDVLHLGVHSFTPVLDGRERRTDLSLLYDPARLAERALADGWTRALTAALPGWRVRRNTPYKGASDGLTTTLRRSFPDPRYMGIEIEVNQRFVRADGSFPDTVLQALVETLPPPR